MFSIASIEFWCKIIVDGSIELSLDFGNQTLERYDLERFNSTIGRMFPWLKNLSLASHKHDFLRVLQLELFRILPRVTNPKLSFL